MNCYFHLLFIQWSAIFIYCSFNELHWRYEPCSSFSCPRAQCFRWCRGRRRGCVRRKPVTSRCRSTSPCDIGGCSLQVGRHSNLDLQKSENKTKCFKSTLYCSKYDRSNNEKHSGWKYHILILLGWCHSQTQTKAQNPD